MIKIYKDLLLKTRLKSMINKKKITTLTKKSELIMLRSDLCDFSDVYIVVEGDITLEGDNDANKKKKKILHLKTMNHLLTAFQKLMTYN